MAGTGDGTAVFRGCFIVIIVVVVVVIVVIFVGGGVEL